MHGLAACLQGARSSIGYHASATGLHHRASSNATSSSSGRNHAPASSAFLPTGAYAGLAPSRNANPIPSTSTFHPQGRLPSASSGLGSSQAPSSLAQQYARPAPQRQHITPQHLYHAQQQQQQHQQQQQQDPLRIRIGGQATSSSRSSGRETGQANAPSQGRPLPTGMPGLAQCSSCHACTSLSCGQQHSLSSFLLCPCTAILLLSWMCCLHHLTFASCLSACCRLPLPLHSTALIPGSAGSTQRQAYPVAASTVSRQGAQLPTLSSADIPSWRQPRVGQPLCAALLSVRTCGNWQCAALSQPSLQEASPAALAAPSFRNFQLHLVRGKLLVGSMW